MFVVFVTLKLQNNRMRRNLWSAANLDIMQPLNYIVGKAKFMETSMLEGEFKKWKHISRFCELVG